MTESDPPDLFSSAQSAPPEPVPSKPPESSSEAVGGTAKPDEGLHAVVVGAAGYTGGETLRLLLHHPGIARITAMSTSQAGRPWFHAHPDLLGVSHENFTDRLPVDPDVLVLCMGHGRSRAFLDQHASEIPPGAAVIDLATDFRHAENALHEATGRAFRYGLPEFHGSALAGHRSVANPGCFATAIQLALAPLAAAGWLDGPVHVQATTGSTGAGQEPSRTTHFSWRSANLSVYKPFTHQHLTEIREQLAGLAGVGEPDLPPLEFIPHRGAFARGIHVAATVNLPDGELDVEAAYRAFYADAPFTHLAPSLPDLKAVVNTNACHIGLLQDGHRLLVVSVIDNLLKGAAGQAVQNLNLMYGFDETAGLRLKASVH